MIMQQSKPRMLSLDIQLEALQILRERFGNDLEITACNIFRHTLAIGR